MILEGEMEEVILTPRKRNVCFLSVRVYLVCMMVIRRSSFTGFCMSFYVGGPIEMLYILIIPGSVEV